MSCDCTKLEYLSETKAEIKATIEANGREVAENTPFREYPKLINEIAGSKPAQAVIIANGIDAEIPLGIAEWKTLTKWNYWQDDDDNAKTTTTVTATPTASCYLLAEVMYRGENMTISGDAWTEIAKVTFDSGDGDSPQTLAVYGKKVKAGTYEVTATQDTSVRMNLKLIALYDAKSVSVVEKKVIAEYPYTPPATTGKRRLYLVTFYWINTSTNKHFKDIEAGELDLMTAETTRTFAHYDYQPELGITPTFDVDEGLNYSTDHPNTDAIITLDIEEE